MQNKERWQYVASSIIWIIHIPFAGHEMNQNKGALPRSFTSWSGSSLIILDKSVEITHLFFRIEKTDNYARRGAFQNKGSKLFSFKNQLNPLLSPKKTNKWLYFRRKAATEEAWRSESESSWARSHKFQDFEKCRRAFRNEFS